MSSRDLVDHLSRPRPNAGQLHLLEYIILNEKVLAGAIAEMSMNRIVAQHPVPDAPVTVELKSKLSTQSDMEADWCRYWVHRLTGAPLLYSRKAWEYAFVSQALYGNGLLRQGKLGLGLGCGTELLPSFFIAQGCKIAAGDQPPEGAASNLGNWANYQDAYTRSAESLYKSQFLTRDKFDENFQLEFVDMNALPESLSGKFDFCWSVCCIEHLGSIERGLTFCRNSLKLLKPGGVSVHTTEFNYCNTEATIDNCELVLYKKEHFLRLAEEIRSLGGTIAPFEFGAGTGILDKYIDLPPFGYQNFAGTEINAQLLFHYNSPHVKLNIFGFPATCFGIIIKKT